MRLEHGSLRTRFILATMLSTIVGLIVIGTLMAAIIRNYIVEGFHEEMEVHIEELSALTATDKSGQPYLLRRLSDPRFIPKNSGMYWEVVRDGFVTLRSPSLENRELPSGLAAERKPHWAFVQGQAGEMLAYGMLRSDGTGGAPLQLLMATDKRMIDEVLTEINWPLIYALASFAAIMIVLGAIQINYSLRPLQRMKRAVAEIRSGNASRMLGNYPTEIEPLVSDLNGLLDANTQMIQSARIQAGNLAHGLRTPLAVMLDEAQSIAKKGDAKSADVFLRGCQQMQRYIDYYTNRARMAAIARLPGQRASLKAAVEPVISAMKRLYRGRKLSICLGDFPDVNAATDEVDLEEMVSNLIDNACKWAKSRVMISWIAEDGQVAVSVDDDGTGISPELYEKVFTVGERLDRSTLGTGLGLSIVRDLAIHYRGAIVLSKSPLGGLRATLKLPLRA
jgi:signal transduction histidine kinase